MTSPDQPRHDDLVVDITDDRLAASGHRLADLVQALTGSSIEGAELALDDPMPTAPVSEDEALSAVAEALVRLRNRQPAV